MNMQVAPSVTRGDTSFVLLTYGTRLREEVLEKRVTTRHASPITTAGVVR
jgi:hypothetical protein